MNTYTILILLLVAVCRPVSADETVDAPKDVPPVVGTAIMSDDSGKLTVQLVIPKVAWKIVGERQPKIAWPELQVHVTEAVVTIPLDYPEETQLSERAQNRIVDVNGRRLKPDVAAERLGKKTPVLISVSGKMPDAFYLQCTRVDTLIVILGIPDAPAPEFLPQAMLEQK